MKRFILVLSSVLLIPTLGLAFLFLNLSHTLLSPDVYKKALNDANAYERILKINATEITKNLLPEDTPIQITSYLDIQSYIPPETLRQTTENALDDFFIKNLRRGDKQLVVDLSIIRDNFFKNSKLPLELLPKDFLLQNFIVPIPASLLFFQPVIAIMPILTYLFFALSLGYLVLIVWLKIGNKSKLRLPAYLIFPLGLFYLIIYLIARFLDPLQFIPIGSIELSKIALDFFNNLKIAFIRPYLIEGIILISASIIVFVISFFIPKERKSKPAKTK